LVSNSDGKRRGMAWDGREIFGGRVLSGTCSHVWRGSHV
jgi:hypothetical protein